MDARDRFRARNANDILLGNLPALGYGGNFPGGGRLRRRKRKARKVRRTRRSRAVYRRTNLVSGLGAYEFYAGGNAGLNVGAGYLNLEGGIRGNGAYIVKHNVLQPDVPGIANAVALPGATIVRHREYLGDVVSSTAFTVQYSLPLNAAQISTFPWLSDIADAFQQYQVNGMLFEFVSTSGDTTSGSTALGTVSMATQYDAVLPPFTTKSQMLNQQFSTSAKPSVSAIHAIECAPNQTTIPLLYTRPGAVPPGADPRLYDLGTFTLATDGQQAGGQTIGELWTTYEVLLFKPQLSGEAGGVEQTGYSHGSCVANGSFTTTAFNPFGTWAGENALGLSFNASGQEIIFPPHSSGSYIAVMQWDGAGAGSSASVAITSSGLIGWPSQPFDGANGGNAIQGTTGSAISTFCFTVEDTFGPQTFAMAWTTVTSTWTTMDIVVQQLPVVNV
jgi:hypothetical protein